MSTWLSWWWRNFCLITKTQLFRCRRDTLWIGLWEIWELGMRNTLILCITLCLFKRRFRMDTSSLVSISANTVFTTQSITSTTRMSTWNPSSKTTASCARSATSQPTSKKALTTSAKTGAQRTKSTMTKLWFSSLQVTTPSKLNSLWKLSDVVLKSSYWNTPLPPPCQLKLALSPTSPLSSLSKKAPKVKKLLVSTSPNTNGTAN